MKKYFATILSVSAVLQFGPLMPTQSLAQVSIGQFSSSQYFQDARERNTFKSEENIIATEVELLTNDKAHLMGLHFKNIGKPTVVLFHGLAANVYYWTQLAEELHKSGFDVLFFNMRGHGGGEFRSTAPGAEKYGFEHIVSNDIPAILDYASEYSMQNTKNPNAKVAVIGHSMGTMVARLALSGFHLWNGQMNRIPEISDDLTKKVSRMISLGSPASFESTMELPSKQSSLKQASVMGKILKLASYKKRPSEFAKEGDSHTDLIISQIAENLVRNPKVAEKVIGGVNVDNFNGDRGELGAFLRKGGSHVEMALMKDLIEFTYNGYKSPSNPRLQFEGAAIPVSLPTTIVLAELDAMAIPEFILRDQYQQPIKDHIQVYEMQGFGHLEMGVGEKAMETILPLITHELSPMQSSLQSKALESVQFSLPKNLRKINMNSCEFVFKF